MKKNFVFSLKNLLKVKENDLAQDQMLLAKLYQEQKRLQLLARELHELFEEVMEESMKEPGLRSNFKFLHEKLSQISKELGENERKVRQCQEGMKMKWQERKVIEKIKENEYTLYQKECARSNDR